MYWKSTFISSLLFEGDIYHDITSSFIRLVITCITLAKLLQNIIIIGTTFYFSLSDYNAVEITLGIRFLVPNFWTLLLHSFSGQNPSVWHHSHTPTQTHPVPTTTPIHSNTSSSYTPLPLQFYLPSIPPPPPLHFHPCSYSGSGSYSCSL